MDRWLNLSQGSLSALHSLDIVPDLVRHLLPTKESVPNLQSVTIRVPSYAYIHNSWLASTENALACLSHREAVYVLRMVFPEPLAKIWLTGEHSNVVRSLHFITHLRIASNLAGSFGQDMEPLLAQWISLFPALEHVRIESSALSHGHEDATFVAQLSGAIAKICPRIQTVMIGVKPVYLGPLALTTSH